ncbi:MAG: NAD(+) synthase [Lentisphaeria bacterium]|nr:NAD(+) synthase [Lentisphaeria bacterium]
MFTSYRIASAVPELIPGNIQYNITQIIDLCNKAAGHGAGVILFPELCITGASCGDLFGSSHLISGVQKAIQEIKKFTSSCECAVVAGFPLFYCGRVYDCAAVFHNGRIAGICGKYSVENPLFTSFAQLDGSAIFLDNDTVPCGKDLIFEADELRFGISVGSDLLAPGTPAELLGVRGAQLILNPTCDGEFAAASREREEQIKVLSSRTLTAIASAGAGTGESGTDMVCGGRAVIFNNGRKAACNTPLAAASSLIYADILPRMTEFRRIREHISNVFTQERYAAPVILGMIPASPDWQELKLPKNPFVPENTTELALRCREITMIQSTALARRVKCTGSRKLVIGLSGGLDSTWAFLICVECCKQLGLAPDTVCAVTMPGFGTSSRTRSNAEKMAISFGAELREIPIADAVTAHFKDIGHDPGNHNVAYENSQARERTQILMDLANELSGIVVGTGDLSELALGWCTFNGDQMAMYGVNGSIPKTLMRHLVTFYAENFASPASGAILKDVVATPVSPELLPGAQHTEELVGSYDLHDFFLWYTVKYGASPEFLQKAAEHVFQDDFPAAEISRVLQIFWRRFQSQQFKRNPMPDGAKAGTFSLSPRTDWHAPSDSVLPFN